jgi:hypothetical protein
MAFPVNLLAGLSSRDYNEETHRTAGQGLFFNIPSWQMSDTDESV